jgi:hypothetical protein
LEQAQKSVCFDNLSKLYLWQAWFQVMKIYVSIFLHNIRLMIKMEYKKNLREKPNKYHWLASVKYPWCDLYYFLYCCIETTKK